MGCFPTGDDFDYLEDGATLDQVNDFVSKHGGTKASSSSASNFVKSSKHMSTGMCNEFCTDNGFTFSAVDTGLVFRNMIFLTRQIYDYYLYSLTNKKKYRNWCGCGNGINTSLADDSNCDTPCPGNADLGTDEMCGGNNYGSVQAIIYI